MFVLVRHGDAGDKHRWPDADDLRPLSAKGNEQADQPVARLLQVLQVGRLMSSPASRCVQTLMPAARTLGLSVETRPQLGVKAPIDQLLQLLDSPKTDGAALCTHGETLTALSDAWRTSGRVQFAEELSIGMARTPKGASWIIGGYHTPGARASYVPSHRVDHFM